MDAHIIIPSLGLSGAVSFLMDTGADKTVIMPADAKRLGIDYRDLRQASVSVGVGGASSDFLERGALVVRDGDFLHAYDVEFIIMRRKKALENVPSLLGRNVMNRWKTTFDPTNLTVTAEIRRSDAKIRLPGKG